MVVLIAENSSMLPFATEADSVPPAEINTIKCVLCICLEGAAGNYFTWKSVKHFDYDFLRLAFRKVLLEQFSLRLPSSFKRLKNQLYKNYPDGFYVRAKPNLCTPDVTIKYISRYLGRPVIATSRIDDYDGEFVSLYSP